MMASKRKLVMVRITTSDARDDAGPAWLSRRSTCHAAAHNLWRVAAPRSTPRSMRARSAGCDGPASGSKCSTTSESRTRRLAKQIGKGNRFLGKDRYPRGLGRLVKGDRGVDVP